MPVLPSISTFMSSRLSNMSTVLIPCLSISTPSRPCANAAWLRRTRRQCTRYNHATAQRRALLHQGVLRGALCAEFVAGSVVNRGTKRNASLKAVSCARSRAVGVRAMVGVCRHCTKQSAVHWALTNYDGRVYATRSEFHTQQGPLPPRHAAEAGVTFLCAMADAATRFPRELLALALRFYTRWRCIHSMLAPWRKTPFVVLQPERSRPPTRLLAEHAAEKGADSTAPSTTDAYHATIRCCRRCVRKK